MKRIVLYIVLSISSTVLTAAENSYQFVIGSSNQADQITKINTAMTTSHEPRTLPRPSGNHITITNGIARDRTGESIRLPGNISLRRLHAHLKFRRRTAAMQREIAAHNRQIALNERRIAALQRARRRIWQNYWEAVRRDRRRRDA